MRKYLLCWILNLLLSGIFFLQLLNHISIHLFKINYLVFLFSYNWKHTIHILCVLLISFYTMLTSVAIPHSFLFQNSFPSFGFSKFTYTFPCWWIFEVLTCFRLLRIVCSEHSCFNLFAHTTMPSIHQTGGRRNWKGKNMYSLLMAHITSTYVFLAKM